MNYLLRAALLTFVLLQIQGCMMATPDVIDFQENVERPSQVVYVDKPSITGASEPMRVTELEIRKDTLRDVLSDFETRHNLTFVIDEMTSSSENRNLALKNTYPLPVCLNWRIDQAYTISSSSETAVLDKFLAPFRLTAIHFRMNDVYVITSTKKYNRNYCDGAS